MLGSLTVYRRLLREKLFTQYEKLPWFGHGLAGVGAGWTVSFIAAPVEHVKARLQVQYDADKSKRLYRGPIDCAKKLVHSQPSSTVMLACFSDSVCSFAVMALPVSTTVSAPRFSSGLSSSSGGVPTTSSPATYLPTPPSRLPPSISGLVACPHKSSGSQAIRPTW